MIKKKKVSVTLKNEADKEEQANQEMVTSFTLATSSKTSGSQQTKRSDSCCKAAIEEYECDFYGIRPKEMDQLQSEVINNLFGAKKDRETDMSVHELIAGIIRKANDKNEK
ncbi:hypothetical protein IW492_15345 [Enterococcus sp. BWB1-3]|uniref:hypothetical protein n=1 Tax=Enterococcus sp. BWB1-3 TaxID=2787713 RepID=UPI0019235249|nr:hypothetical protein [Enterococcus sp. BWB1-3]MBL1230605.1 hypothetical protein [Enterococcus sp. BWB1-3]